MSNKKNELKEQEEFSTVEKAGAVWKVISVIISIILFFWIMSW